MRRSRILSRSFLVAFAVVCLCALAASTASASPTGRNKTNRVVTFATGATIPLRTAVFDPFAFAGNDYATAFKLTQSSGASYVRIVVAWSGIAPASPDKSFVAADPTSPGYQWSWLDSVVGSAEQAGLTPILDVGSPPSWAMAQTAKAPNAGTPSPKALGDFATALATHYDGLPDANGAIAAPAVHVYQVWNEPNLTLDMSPTSPANYRSMVNAFAAAVHAVDPTNLVVAGALDPFGHKAVGKTKWSSMSPLTFMRSLLCLSAGAHPHATCHDPIHFDVWAHHPYTFGGPFAKARNVGDVSLGDLPAMRSVLQAGVKLHTVVSTHPVQFWVTEFGWDTSPPRSGAAPLALAERWTAESLYQMWRSGVSLVTWFDFQDQPGKSTYQSGLYYWAKNLAKARAKPTRTAFRFPFVAYLSKGRVSIWGRDATSTKQTVTIQMRAGKSGGWRTIARVQANRYGIFKGTIKVAAKSTNWLRAAAPGSGNSLAFSLTVPKDPHIGPWGRAA